MNGTTMTEFLAEHSGIRLDISYMPVIEEYRVDVYSTEYLHGKAKLQTFAYSKNIIDRLNVDFDTIIGNSLYEWWRSLSIDDVRRVRGIPIERIPYTVSIADEALTFKDPEGGDAQ